MKKFLIALAALGFSSAASATPWTVAFDDTHTVQYVSFNVATQSTFSIAADSVPGYTLDDPAFFLFSGLLADIGSAPLVAEDDNGGSVYNSLKQVNLSAGDYFLAVSDSLGLGLFSETYARSGTNPDITGCAISTNTTCGEVVVSVTDIGQYVPPTPAPEPASLALMGLGLASLAAVRRRKFV